MVVSALTTGFASGTVSYDYDSDPAKRKRRLTSTATFQTRGSRGPCCWCALTLNSALLLLVRAFCVSMLVLVNKRYFVALLEGVFGGKGGSGRLPVDGAVGLFVSLMMRVEVKTMTDFTGVIQFRHSVDLGGLYWTVNVFLALLASFGSVFAYYADTGKEVVTGGGKNGTFEIEERVAWTLVGSLSGAWVTVFEVFLLLMKKEYRRRVKHKTMQYFLKGDNVVVVRCNEKQWWAIREDVKEWVLANWDHTR